MNNNIVTSTESASRILARINTQTNISTSILIILILCSCHPVLKLGTAILDLNNSIQLPYCTFKYIF